MSGVKVDLNRRNLRIYESIAYSPTADATTFTDIDTVYNKLTLDVLLTKDVNSGNYVISNPNNPPNYSGTGSSYRSFISPNTNDANGSPTTINATSSQAKQISSYVSYNSGTPVIVNSGDGAGGSNNLFTIFEVYDYIINKLDTFNNAMTYVQRCDLYTKLSYNMTSDPIQLSIGKGNYSDNDTSCAMFANTTTVTNIKQPNGVPYFTNNAKVFAPSLYHSEGAYDYLKGIPAWASTVEQKPVLKTQPYIDTSKSLIQQLADLINLTQNYQAILEKYKGTTGNINYVISTDGITKIPLDNSVTNSYNFTLTDLSNKVDILRNQLDNRVAEILASQSSFVYQSQLLKDSSIYANVMWTILATSLIYYVFVKL